MTILDGTITDTLNDGSQDQGMGGGGQSIFGSKKLKLDAKAMERRKVMLQLLREGKNPGQVRLMHVMSGFDETEADDAINTYMRITTGTPKPQETTEATALDYANAIRNKQITLNDVPEEGKSLVVRELSGLGATGTPEAEAKEKERQMATDIAESHMKAKVDTIDELKDNWYLDAAVGPNPLVRFSATDWATGGKQDFISAVNQIIDQETLQTLIDLKAQGGTLGALSEKELQILQSAASRISSWAVHEDGKPEGKVTGFDISEKAFKEELDRIKESMQRVVEIKKRYNTGEGGASNQSIKGVGTGQKNSLSGTTSSGLKYVIE